MGWQVGGGKPFHSYTLEKQTNSSGEPVLRLAVNSEVGAVWL